MKTKKAIVDNWLPRYTGTAIGNFGEYILITNFGNCAEMFAQRAVSTAIRDMDLLSLPSSAGVGHGKC